MAIGSLVAFLSEQKKSEAASFAGVAIILTAVFTYDDKLPDPSFYTLLPTCGTALFIVFGNGTRTGSILSEKNLVTIGLISYSVYLIHQPMFAFYRIQSLRVVNTNDLIVLIIATISLAYLTWRFVENPFRDKSKVSLALLLVAAAASFTFVYVFLWLMPLPDLVKSEITIPNIVKYKTSANESSTNSSRPNSDIERYIALYGDDGSIVPKEYDVMACHLFHTFATNEKNALFCHIGLDKFNSPPTYFLTGDSMAKEYSPVFNAIEGSGVFGTIGDICPTTLVRPDSPKAHYKADEGYRCSVFHEHVFSYIKNNATTIRKVFVTTNWAAKLDNSSHLDVIYAIKRYAEINVAVYLLEQPPVQKLHVGNMFESLKRQNNLTEKLIRDNSLTIQELLKNDAKWYQPFLKRVQYSSPLVHIYTRNYLCDSECCPIGTVSGAFYHDKIHILPVRSIVLAPLFLSII
jgi:hypothetical protein